eukprot:217270-Prymnesium_polylepis.1
MLGDAVGSITTLRCVRAAGRGLGGTRDWRVGESRAEQQTWRAVKRPARGSREAPSSHYSKRRGRAPTHAARSANAGVLALESLDISSAPPSINYMATTGLGQDSAAIHARMYKDSVYGAQLTADARALAEHYVRCVRACARAWEGRGR